MITALDTNILSVIWSGGSEAPDVAASLSRASEEGALIICGPVYAELLAYPRATADFVGTFLTDTRIAVEFELHKDIWTEAGCRFGEYSKRRRRSGAGEPKRLLIDFLVGGHALHRADRLYTLDASRYRRDFPELELL